MILFFLFLHISQVILSGGCYIDSYFLNFAYIYLSIYLSILILQ